jgi:hypothetical protein
MVVPARFVGFGAAIGNPRLTGVLRRGVKVSVAIDTRCRSATVFNGSLNIQRFVVGTSVALPLPP